MAGDFRANQHLMLTSLHTVFLREHNRIARSLKKTNPQWSPNIIFHETRKIVGAIVQHITYDYYLPEVLGPSGMQLMGPYEGIVLTIGRSTVFQLQSCDQRLLLSVA